MKLARGAGARRPGYLTGLGAGRLWLAVLVLLATGCEHFAVKNAEVYQALKYGDPEAALQSLETNKRSRRDYVLYQLDKALLLSMLGNYQAGNEVFESAKSGIERLSATSITENITSVVINEATRSYAGQPYEQLLLYAYKALNYLSVGDVTAARVEVLQADVKMREWAAAKEIEGILASAFVRYLSGLVFEMNGEWSDALIAYRKAYRILHENGRIIPEYLQHDLLRLTAHQDLQGEHAEYKEEFAAQGWLSWQDLKQRAQLVLIMHQGLVSSMQQESIMHFAPELNYSVRISVPYYPLQRPYIGSSSFSIGARQAETEVIEDIDQLARDNLAARMPGLMLRTIARVVAKKAAAKEAGKDNALFGFLTDVAGLATEIADTRSWTSLPASIGIARVAVPPGRHRLDLPQVGYAAFTPEQQEVELNAGEIKVISLHDTAY